MPISLQDSIVKIAAPAVAPATPTFAQIADTTGYSATHGSEGVTRTRVFGLATPYLLAGDLTDSYDIKGLYNPGDTGGQNVLRAARDNRTAVLLQILPDGVAGYQQECRVTEYTDSGDADGDYVECSFTLESSGPRTTI